ncbi:MAG: general secretion pathway protein GspF [Gammaproteobacteria bacterium]|nr:MAG: general secretion pathway protein GspF [Gammaproteobacteria bacterium]
MSGTGPKTKDLRPKTPEEYVSLVENALFEIEDLRAAAEYDEDSMGGVLKFIDELESQVRALRDRMADGTYRFEDRDLPFMKLVKRTDDRLLPFKQLLVIINATHRKGLNVEEEE